MKSTKKAHIKLSDHKIAFEKTYRISYRAFKKLTSILEIRLQVITTFVAPLSP